MKKIHQFLSSIKKMHAKENWSLFCLTVYNNFGYIVRFSGVGRGRGVKGRRAVDDVGRSPTAAASGGGPETPLSERASFCCVYAYGVISDAGMEHICPIVGSTWPLEALRGGGRKERALRPGSASSTLHRSRGRRGLG